MAWEGLAEAEMERGAIPVGGVGRTGTMGMEMEATPTTVIAIPNLALGLNRVIPVSRTIRRVTATRVTSVNPKIRPRGATSGASCRPLN